MFTLVARSRGELGTCPNWFHQLYISTTFPAAAVMFEHEVTFRGGADLPVYVRVSRADGHQAWSSPIYLIA